MVFIFVIGLFSICPKFKTICQISVPETSTPLSVATARTQTIKVFALSLKCSKKLQAKLAAACRYTCPGVSPTDVYTIIDMKSSTKYGSNTSIFAKPFSFSQCFPSVLLFSSKVALS